jgi:hypothetical protein
MKKILNILAGKDTFYWNISDVSLPGGQNMVGGKIWSKYGGRVCC